MQERQEDVAVRCWVPGRLFGKRHREALEVLIVGTLVHAQGPYEDLNGVRREGWPDHFHSLNVYAESQHFMHPLYIADNACYEACERTAIDQLRYLGELPDDDHEFATQYG